MFRICVHLRAQSFRSFSQETFKQRGIAAENVFIRGEDDRLLKKLRKRKSELCYQRYKAQKKKIEKENAGREKVNRAE